MKFTEDNAVNAVFKSEFPQKNELNECSNSVLPNIEFPKILKCDWLSFGKLIKLRHKVAERKSFLAQSGLTLKELIVNDATNSDENKNQFENKSQIAIESLQTITKQKIISLTEVNRRINVTKKPRCSRQVVSIISSQVLNQRPIVLIARKQLPYFFE